MRRTGVENINRKFFSITKSHLQLVNTANRPNLLHNLVMPLKVLRNEEKGGVKEVSIDRSRIKELSLLFITSI